MKVLVLFLMLLAFPAMAQDESLKDGDVLRGRFVQERHLQGFAQPVRSEGSFVVAPGKGLIWKAEKPFPVLTVVTPKGLMQKVGAAETTRLSAAQIPFMARLYDMLAGALSGDWRALEGAFAVSRSGNVVALAATGDSPIKSITARLNRFVEQVEIAKPNGDFDRLVFRDQVLNQAPLDGAEADLLK